MNTLHTAVCRVRVPDLSAFVKRTPTVIGALLLLAVLVSDPACLPQPPRAPLPASTEPGAERVRKQQPKIDIAKLEKLVHDGINRERRRHGLPTLRWDDPLSGIAREHSRDMAKRNYFSHTSPEGNGFSYRYRKSGYACGITVNNIIYTGAENIFQNNLYDRITTVNGVKYYDWNSMEEIADSTVEGWMNSPGHRQNILTPHWQREGIGIFVAPDDKVYITQNFC
jgi:uncharacterized protein YkwD